MTKAGERLLRSVKQVRAYVRGEITEGFVVHEAKPQPDPEPPAKPTKKPPAKRRLPSA